MKPALATISIYTFLQCWNELMFANVFISDSKFKTLPVGIQALSGQYTTEWGPIGAALVIAGLAADGVTAVDDIHFIQRGYEDFEEKLRGIGASIEKVDGDHELQKFILKVS
jgi:ABC-type glycerol-3-phosphate transport system permease component